MESNAADILHQKQQNGQVREAINKGKFVFMRSIQPSGLFKELYTLQFTLLADIFNRTSP